MKNSFSKKLALVVLALIVLAVLLKVGRSRMDSDDNPGQIAKNSILHLDLSGVIFNGKKFLKHLKQFKGEDHIKAVLIQINSPGGAVGPSQEIFTEINRFKLEEKKPVICVTTGIMASGAYYSAVACDKIVVAPGALVGSIGVIMEFANLEKLYDWAKVSRYSITSGKFKDSGAEYRPMREEEKALFQSMINEVYAQFRKTVQDSRKLSDEVLNQYADGRVFTGAKAVELGFADRVGTYEDAARWAAELAGLGTNYEIFEIPKKRRTLWDLGDGNEDDPLNSLFSKWVASKDSTTVQVGKLLQTAFPTELLNQPLYLMPGTFQREE